MIALPARQLIRFRGWVIAAWAVLALLFAPKATHVQRVLAVRGTYVEQTESARASQLIREAFPNPIAEYVAIVVHGPVRYTHPRFETVLAKAEMTPSHRAQIGAFARKHAISPFVVFLSGLAATLHRMTGQADLCLQSVFDLRLLHSDLRRTMGPFHNPLVIRLDGSGHPDLAELTRRAKPAVLEAQRNVRARSGCLSL